MSKINEWVEKRNNELLKNSLLERGVDLLYFLNEIEKEQGKEARDFFVKKLLKSIGTESGNENDLIKNQTIFQEKTDSVIEFIVKKSILQKNLKTISDRLSQFSYADLEKMAMNPKDINKLKNNSAKMGEEVVSSDFHKQKYPAPEAYKKFLNSPKISTSLSNTEDLGISPKVIHVVKNDFFMTKPYHTEGDEDTKTFQKDPISGWATMATKGLFDAGGIGKLCEDVGVHSVDNLPVTVHSFATDHDHVFEIKDKQRFSNPPSIQFKQIAAMDYLTNNLDRHGGNLMQSDPDENGNENILAIDHDRNFQYHRAFHSKWHPSGRPGDEEIMYTSSKGQPPIGLKAFFNKSKGMEPYYQAFNRKVEEGKEDKTHADLANWWKNHSKPIKEAFLDHAAQIKDQNVREHVCNNFLQRHASMDEWVKRMDEPDKYPKTELPAVSNIIERKLIENPVLQKMVKDKDLMSTASTLNQIVDGYIKKGFILDHKTKKALTDTFAAKIKNSSPEELAKTYEEMHTNKNFVQTHEHERFMRNMDEQIQSFLHRAGSSKHRSEIIKTIDRLLKDKRDSLEYPGMLEAHRDSLADTELKVGLGLIA